MGFEGPSQTPPKPTLETPSADAPQEVSSEVPQAGQTPEVVAPIPVEVTAENPETKEKQDADAGTQVTTNPEEMSLLQEQTLKENAKFDQTKLYEAGRNHREAEEEFKNYLSSFLRSMGIRQDAVDSVMHSQMRGPDYLISQGGPKARETFKEFFARNVGGKGFDLMKLDRVVDSIMESPQLARVKELRQELIKLQTKK